MSFFIFVTKGGNTVSHIRTHKNNARRIRQRKLKTGLAFTSRVIGPAVPGGSFLKSTVPYSELYFVVDICLFLLTKYLITLNTSISATRLSMSNAYLAFSHSFCFVFKSFSSFFRSRGAFCRVFIFCLRYSFTARLLLLYCCSSIFLWHLSISSWMITSVES